VATKRNGLLENKEGWGGEKAWYGKSPEMADKLSKIIKKQPFGEQATTKPQKHIKKEAGTTTKSRSRGKKLTSSVSEKSQARGSTVGTLTWIVEGEKKAKGVNCVRPFKKKEQGGKGGEALLENAKEVQEHEGRVSPRKRQSQLSSKGLFSPER